MNYEKAHYNLQFIALLFSENAEFPEPPEQKNKEKKILSTNDAGLALLQGLF